MLHRLQNTEWVVPEDILNIFLGQPPLHQAVSQAGVAFNPGKADSKAGASIQIAAQGNMGSSRIQLHKMKHMVTHRIQSGLLSQEAGILVDARHAAGPADGAEHIVRQVAAVGADGAGCWNGWQSPVHWLSP